MDYVTRYYKNLAEDLSRRLNHLQILVEASKLKDDEMVDPETGMPVMALPNKFARSPYVPTESDKLVSNAFSVPGSFQPPTPLSLRPQLGRVQVADVVTTPEEDLKSGIATGGMSLSDSLKDNPRLKTVEDAMMIDHSKLPVNSYAPIRQTGDIIDQIEREREARHPEAAKQKEAAQNEIEFIGNSRIPTGMGGIEGELYDLLDKTFPYYNKVLGMRRQRAYEKLKKNPTYPWYDPSTTKQ